MTFIHNGKQVRRSTETYKKKLAQKIEAKCLTQAVEGKWFEKPMGANKILSEFFN